MSHKEVTLIPVVHELAILKTWEINCNTNSANISHSSQFFYLWSTKNQRYCSNSWFIYSVCLSICRWNDGNSFVSIYNILFNFFINSTSNWDPLSEITLFGTLYNFYILSLNNLANLSTNIPSIVTTKCAILNNLLQTTRITFFSATNSNFVIKFTIKYVYSFSSTLFVINFSAGFSI